MTQRSERTGLTAMIRQRKVAGRVRGAGHEMRKTLRRAEYDRGARKSRRIGHPARGQAGAQQHGPKCQPYAQCAG